MLTKYGTYRVFKHKETGEIKRILIKEANNDLSLKKLSNIKDQGCWIELDEDPEIKEPDGKEICR